MDLKASPYNKKESTFEENPFANRFSDSLCKLNLKETSEFVKAFPTLMARKNKEGGVCSVVAPASPVRPVFRFSGGNGGTCNFSRKCIPSKWDDAGKWLINSSSSSSCHESPAAAHVIKASDSSKISKRSDGDAFAQKLRVADQEKLRGFHGSLVSLNSNLEVVLLDKFTDNVEPPPCPNYRLSDDSTKERFFFSDSFNDSVKPSTINQSRDIGTEMTPIGSVATSKCHTPIKSSSPARHNTPANMSGPLVMDSNTTFDISELNDCHFAKLKLSEQYDSMVASHWSSREEEEAEVSESLRHSDKGFGRKSFVESRASLWEDEERTQSCKRYQSEEAKIQAWVRLQGAKAEAQSRKLEVKIEKLRSKFEEKVMRRMAIVERRAEEWKAAAGLRHSQKILRASEQAHKMKTEINTRISCGCFPCNSHH